MKKCMPLFLCILDVCNKIYSSYGCNVLKECVQKILSMLFEMTDHQQCNVIISP